MWVLWGIAVLLLIVGTVGEGRAEEALGTRPLLTIAPKDLHTILPQDSHILIEPRSLEQFLDALDTTPPDWDLIYGRNLTGEGANWITVGLTVRTGDNGSSD